MISNKYTYCVVVVGNLGTLRTYLQFFSLHMHSFSGLDSWKWWLSFLFSERHSELQPCLSFASGLHLLAWCQDKSNTAAMAVIFSKHSGIHSSHLEDTETTENTQSQHYCCTFTYLILSRKITKAFYKYWTHTTSGILPIFLLRVVNKYYTAASKLSGEDSILVIIAALTI